MKAKEVPFHIASLILKLTGNLKVRGPHGLIELQRSFRLRDQDDIKRLNLGTFKTAIKELNVTLQDNDLRKIFEYFDHDNSNLVNYEEFLTELRGVQLNVRRSQLIEAAFSKLDVEHMGTVPAEVCAKAYTAAGHPEAIAGRLAPREVMRSFLEYFDVGSEVQGGVTKAEFRIFCENTGWNISNDAYFELMLRNVWGLCDEDIGGIGSGTAVADTSVLHVGATVGGLVSKLRGTVLSGGNTCFLFFYLLMLFRYYLPICLFVLLHNCSLCLYVTGAIF
jgi:hypothetical protein